jgi:hypothetical protein
VSVLLLAVVLISFMGCGGGGGGSTPASTSTNDKTEVSAVITQAGGTIEVTNAESELFNT